MVATEVYTAGLLPEGQMVGDEKEERRYSIENLSETLNFTLLLLVYLCIPLKPGKFYLMIVKDLSRTNILSI